jgi:hypothetical protein
MIAKAARAGPTKELSLSKRSIVRATPFRIAKTGKINAPKGRYERCPAKPDGGRDKSNGIECAPIQIHNAARSGSPVLPVALPAVAHAISAIKDVGSKSHATLRKTWGNAAPSTRVNIVIDP